MVTHEKKIEIAKMTQHQAEEIVDTWKHEGIYQFYDMTEDPDVELGLGLKPEYTGKGFGKSFVNIVVDFLISNYHLLKINLSGVSLNRKAIRCYEKWGFRKTGVIQQLSNVSVYEFVTMQLEI